MVTTGETTETAGQSGWGSVRREHLIVVAAVLAVAGVAAARTILGGSDFHRLWGEDGFDYWLDTVTLGPRAVFLKSSGYVQLLPRALALAALVVPAALFALYAWVVSLGVVGLAGGYVYGAARRYGLPVAWSLAASLALVLPGAHGTESLGNLTDLQWFLLPAGAWAMVVSRAGDTGRRRVVDVGLCLSLALTTPLSVLILPMALRRGERRPSPAVAALLGGLITQAALILWAPDSPLPNAEPRMMGQNLFAPLGAVFYAGLSTWFGLPWSHVNAASGLGAIVILVIVWGALSPAVGSIEDIQGRRQSLRWALLALALVTLPAWVTGSITARYVGVGLSLIAMGVIVRAARTPRSASRVALVLSLLLTVPAFGTTWPSGHPVSWAAEVEAARARCEHQSLTVVDVQWMPTFVHASPVPCRALAP